MCKSNWLGLILVCDGMLLIVVDAARLGVVLALKTEFGCKQGRWAVAHRTCWGPTGAVWHTAGGHSVALPGWHLARHSPASLSGVPWVCDPPACTLWSGLGGRCSAAQAEAPAACL